MEPKLGLLGTLIRLVCVGRASETPEADVGVELDCQALEGKGGPAGRV
jgi:hypothetical protein